MLDTARVVLLLLTAFLPAFCYTPAMENQGRRPDPAEAAAILKAICPAGAQVKDSPQGEQIYCSPCPDFTSLHGLTTEQFRLRWALPGHFTAPEAQELAAFFEGCEPLSANFGGAVLLNKTADGWKMARYDSALNPASVRSIRLKTGRDLLFGEANVIGLGLITNSLYTFDFMQQPATARQPVLTLADTTRACGYDITKESLDKVTWQDQNFTAAVRWGTVKAGPDYLRDCPDKIPEVPVETYELRFVFDGMQFQPAADSKEIFDRINTK